MSCINLKSFVERIKIGFPFFIIIAFFSAVFNLSTQEPYIRYKNLNGIRYLYLSDLAKCYGMSLKQTNDGCEIRNQSARFYFYYEKRSGSLNGIAINYLYSPVYLSGIPLVSEADYKKLILPLLYPNFVIPKKTVKRVVIDPGHGGKDNGAQTLYREKDLNLAIALKLRDELKKRGFVVFMTREKDTFLELEQRTAIAEKVKADIFISIHCNSASNRYIRGIETFCLTPEGAPSSSEKKASGSKQRGNAFDNQNVYLAYLIQHFLIGNTASQDRGVKHARFAVLRTSSCPAVLVECGFLTNQPEMKNLAWGKYQQALAEAIAAAIVYYSKTVK